MPHAFGNDERIAVQGDRDVMMPAWKAAAFVMVQAQFALERVLSQGNQARRPSISRIIPR